jgi:hypothetical protein
MNNTHNNPKAIAAPPTHPTHTRPKTTQHKQNNTQAIQHSSQQKPKHQNTRNQTKMSA